MASKWPPVKNAGYTFRVVLFARADNQIKSNPTIAAGDFKVSTDGAAFANLGTLPDVDPDSTVQVLITLSAAEMNGDEVMVTAIDASGAEWHDQAWVIHTVAQTLDTVATNLATVDGIVDDILTDTGTTLDTLIKDVPTVSEFNARTLAAADYFDPAADTVANVTTVGSVTGSVGSVTGAVGSVTGAVGSVTGNVGGNVTGSVGSVAAGGITAASIATDAIDNDAIAANAVTELQSGLATAANLATLAGYVDTEVASILAAVDTEVAAIKAKTDNLPASPAATGDAMTLTAAYDAAKTAATQASVDDIPTNAELAAALAAADDAVLAAIAALNNLSQAGAQAGAAAALTAYGAATAGDVSGLNDISTADILAMAYEGAETLQAYLRLSRAALVGKASGDGVTIAFRDAADTKDRITATVTPDGDRTSVTVDAT